MSSVPLLVLLVAVSPAIERAVDVVSCGVELARATAARVLEAPSEREREDERDAPRTQARPLEASRAPRTPRVHTAGLMQPVLQEQTRALPRPPVDEPGAARGPPTREA